MLTVTDTGGGAEFKKLDPGTYAAVCTQIIDIGPQVTPWGESNKIKIRFEVPSERAEWQDSDGQSHEGPMVIWASYTASLSEKANLRKDLESWRGRAFTPEELKGFDITKILGQPCMISVKHKTSQTNGKTYANIASISRLVKGMETPKAEGDLIAFDIDNHTREQYDALPEWLQKLVSEGLKLKAEQSDRVYDERNPPDDFENTDIPF